MQVAVASDIVVLDAMARASLTPTATSGAIYLSVAVTGDKEDRLISVSTPASAGAELHKTIMEGDIMKMRPLENGWEILPGRIYSMQKDGLHIMLIGLKQQLKKGDSVPLELVFEKAGVVKLDVPVGEVAVSHEHMD